MPTFTVIALDRLLEPGSRNPAPKPPPLPPAKMGMAVPGSSERKRNPLPHASPALYTTPEVTPLPDSPSSFPPSPYIVDHKRRGPRLLKSLSQNDVRGCRALPDAERKAEVVDGTGDGEVEDDLPDGKLGSEQKGIDGCERQGEEIVNGYHHRNLDDANSVNGLVEPEESLKLGTVDPEKDGDCEDFFDLQDSMSTASTTDADDSNGPERLWKPHTPLGEYFDALEEISNEGTTRSSYRNFEDELRQMRLNLLMEIERRKQVEEALDNVQNQWRSLSDHLSLVGLILPSPPTITEETNEQSDLNPAEVLCRQIVISRFVACSMGRGCARAEVELEMEPQIESKNFEIARLCDRLQYYEAANREMSQRNQEAVEMARQDRYRRKKRQRWLWRSIGVTVTLGAAALAWSYFPRSKPLPSLTHEGDHAVASHAK